MSRVGKKPIPIPEKVKVAVSGRKITVEGPRGKMEIEIHPRINCEVSDGKVIVKRSSDDKFDRSLHGLSRSLIQNMILGTTQGFEKTLLIEGVGFKAELKGPKLRLSLGFSHPIEYVIPAGIKIETPPDKR
jgi:large subunit ribosomal protein L6